MGNYIIRKMELGHCISYGALMCRHVTNFSQSVLNYSAVEVIHTSLVVSSDNDHVTESMPLKWPLDDGVH